MRRKEYRYEEVEEPVTGHRYWKTQEVELPSLDEGDCFLSMITDAYSHKIVGWAVGSTFHNSINHFQAGITSMVPNESVMFSSSSKVTMMRYLQDNLLGSFMTNTRMPATLVILLRAMTQIV